MLRGAGPICRLDVNGTIHKDQGRTHKHELRDESDPRVNLPFAVSRSDIDVHAASVREIWEGLCAQANIEHVGAFSSPDGD